MARQRQNLSIHSLQKPHPSRTCDESAGVWLPLQAFSPYLQLCLRTNPLLVPVLKASEADSCLSCQVSLGLVRTQEQTLKGQKGTLRLAGLPLKSLSTG